MKGTLLALRRYPEALRHFRWSALWELFDGTPDRLNIAHECVDRHPAANPALRIWSGDGRRDEVSFGELAARSSQFANFLTSQGIAKGDRVGIMLEPSPLFYAALFGTMKRGAIAVPLFTLFGPEGLALRVNDCRPRMLLVDREPASRWQPLFPDVRVVAVDPEFGRRLDRASPHYTPDTAADDLAVFQYTSGTTRALPEAVRHTHRAVVTLMVAALYGVGLEQDDRYFCPSSPAWGHGLWHGTIAPLALGIATGAYAGKFDARSLLEALDTFAITNVAAAPTVFRLLSREEGVNRSISLRKVSFTGEPMDDRTWDFIEHRFGVTPCGMYGSTEVGVIIVNYPGFTGYEVRRGALGKAAPGWEVGIVDEQGQPLPHGQTGEIAVRRKGGWFPVKDRGQLTEDGYFYHAGRSDDVIISAGWTMSAVEIENVLLAHPVVRDVAVVGVSDPLRGQIPKAFVVVAAGAGAELARELQEHVKNRLSQHEYPRTVEFVLQLPRTPAGKVDRRALRGA